jgi:RNA polymerase sigma-70 factor (ECF subfamily)
LEKFLHTENELLEKLKEGDTFAFEVLFYKYRNKIKGFATRLVPTQIDPDEIVQEVFVKIWLKKECIDPEKNFQSYLFSIAKNLILDHLKSAVNRKLYFVEEHFQQDLITEEDAEIQFSADTEERLLSLIQQIPERRRDIFCLSRFAGLSYKQIAEKLNITENTVDSQIRNSLTFLRNEFRKIATLFFLCFFQ